MHAAIRHYAPDDGSREAWIAVWRALAIRLAREDGFISCAVLQTTGGELAAISFFDDVVSLTAAEHKLDSWLAERDIGPARIPLRATTGEVVAQRGL